jgi:hypothetical protein
MFCTSDYQRGKVNNNQCIECDYNDETDGQITTFGIIKKMYYHRLCWSMPERVILAGDWYGGYGCSRTGLRQVKYLENFRSENMAFFDQCSPISLVLWPSATGDFDIDNESSWRAKDTEFCVVYR